MSDCATDKVGNAQVMSRVVQNQFEGLQVSLTVIHQTLHERYHRCSSRLGPLKRFIIWLAVQEKQNAQLEENNSLSVILGHFTFQLVSN